MNHDMTLCLWREDKCSRALRCLRTMAEPDTIHHYYIAPTRTGEGCPDFIEAQPQAVNALDAEVLAEAHDSNEREFSCQGALPDGRLCGQGYRWEKPSGWARVPTPEGLKSYVIIFCDKCKRWHARFEQPERVDQLNEEKKKCQS